MKFKRYRVTDEDGTFLDEFGTNAPDIATKRIGRIRKHRPGLTVQVTDDDRKATRPETH
ncbi:hypothetical protein [Streptomyces sp. NPDC058657]|uniref:hypothetical protein n=1 Tax=unclassified Streptomyces TaxID=2593676 RepID=UPI00366600B0